MCSANSPNQQLSTGSLSGPCFRKPRQKGRRRKHPFQELLNAVFCLVRTGCQWRKRAGRIRIRVRWKASPRNIGKARTRAMHGRELYVKINGVLVLCGYERRRLPPPEPKFGVNPVQAELRIGLVKGRLAIKLGVRGAPVNDVMVFGSPPRRAGQGPGGNYAFLGLLPPPKGGESEITGLYLTKLREWRKVRSAQYQVPLAGARICIRTWPQDNGWEGKGLIQVSQGLAPRGA